MSADPWVVVPTAGRSTLEPAIDSTGIPRERVVVVVTAPNAVIPSWCRAVADFGDVNIQRWWNAGLDFVAEQGGRLACVINDDVLLEAGTIPALVEAMQRTGATLATPGHEDRLVAEPSHDRVLDGACWLIDLSHGIRPDEGYRWWYGDNDLDWRARRDGGGVALVSTPYQHLLANRLTEGSEELRALADADARRWARRE